jgi:circadian clock protein KaiB
MKTTKSASNSLQELKEDKGWLLRLYVTMQSTKSIKAHLYLEEICEMEKNGNYQIELINLLRNPQLGPDHQILPTTKVVMKLPEPFRKIIEDLNNSDRVLVGIDLISTS